MTVKKGLSSLTGLYFVLNEMPDHQLCCVVHKGKQDKQTTGGQSALKANGHNMTLRNSGLRRPQTSLLWHARRKMWKDESFPLQIIDDASNGKKKKKSFCKFIYLLKDEIMNLMKLSAVSAFQSGEFCTELHSMFLRDSQHHCSQLCCGRKCIFQACTFGSHYVIQIFSSLVPMEK